MKRVMLFGPLPSWTWIDTQREEKGKKTEKKKENVTRQVTGGIEK